MDDFKINRDFAKKYNQYREKEELQKLKSRYGDVDSGSSESESEDENAEALTPGLERDFLRTLSYLKNEDPAIYDKSKKFYEEQESDEVSDSENGKEKSSKPMFLKDYDRKVILENEGKFVEDTSDADEVERETRESSPTYHEEQLQLKEDIKKAITMADEVEDDGEGLLMKRNQSSREKEKDEEEFRTWLKTPENQTHLDESQTVDSNTNFENVVSEVKPLKAYWTDPELDDGEKFLRDYILDRKYLDPNADEETPTYDEIIGAESESEIDEEFENKSEMFEKKYNFRYQEPDQEFMKSYPRTIGTSVRRKDDSRKKKRDEKKLKDDEKKRKKQEELKQLKALKKKEIMNKIQKLQEATGNKDMNFSQTDLEVDFDPEEHDKRMQEIFSNYDNDYEEEKPIFSDEDEMEDDDRYWDHYEDEGEVQPDCEDPDFVMDCDYDPVEHQKKKEAKKSKKGKIQDPIAAKKDKNTKKSAFYDSVSKPKPAFDPNEKSFEKYLDEYYALDYEDLIGDLPCRFKYREVVPNDFGLETDEILTATDKELNSWSSLKRAIQYRKDADENYDVGKYRKKGKNIWKKARVLRSVYKLPEEGGSEQDETKSESTNDLNHNSEPHPPEGKKKKMNSRKRRRLKERAEKLKLLQDDVEETAIENLPKMNGDSQSLNSNSTKLRTSKLKSNNSDRPYDKIAKLSNDRLKAYGLEPKKFLKKMKYSDSNKIGGR